MSVFAACSADSAAVHAFEARLIVRPRARRPRQCRVERERRRRQ